MDLLKIEKAVSELNEKTLPAVNAILEERMEQLDRMLAIHIEALSALVDRVEILIKTLNGMALRLEIPNAVKKENEK